MINVILITFCRNTGLLKCLFIIHHKIFFLMPASEIILKEKMFPNCSPRAAKIMGWCLYFARGKSNGSSIFSKWTNGSSYCGILRLNAMLEKCLLKVRDISSSLSITSFFSILCLRALCLRKKTLQRSKKYL